MLNLTLDSLLALSVTQNASDLHLSSGDIPFIRKFGELKRLSTEPLTCSMLTDALFMLLSQSQKTQLSINREIDFAYENNKIGRFRVNIFYQRRGISAVFRRINHTIPSLDDINAPDIFKKLVTLPQGLILVTGATGSGKSTTLASLIEHVNRHYAKHIITLEDPIEFIYHNDKSLIQQREMTTFSSAIKGILRQDPDIILLGELRCKDTIQAALTAAETGHLVLATLHTHCAVQTLNRIIDVFDSNMREFIRQQLADSLQSVISQKLIKAEQGQKAIFEVLINTPAVSNLIRDGKIKQIYSLIQTGQQYGMQFMQ